MLLMSDPRVSDVPVIECGEGLTDISRLPAFLLDPRKQDPAGVGAKLRATVVDRLLTAQEALPGGIRFLIIEGYRPPALQQRYFGEHRADIARMHPEWGPELLIDETSKHVAPPTVAAHPCGAAVDLTLARDGLELDLGTPVNATPVASDDACFTAAENITEEARAWREVLGGALSRVGLVNYPPEWWHWSYGDRYWATVTGAAQAIYAPADDA